MSTRKPWFKFFGSDWRGDAGLRGCSFAARGLWMDLLTLMHEADPYGSLLVNGRDPNARQLAGMLGGTEKQITSLLAELEEAGVFSRKDDGTIFSRRMERDHMQAGVDKKNGQAGGNPSLKGGHGHPHNGSPKGGVNPPNKAHIPEARIQKPEGELRSPPRARGADPDFVAFWTEYPRKDDRGHAARAFATALRKASAGDILLGLRRYQFSAERRFQPLAATWLTGERWRCEHDTKPPNVREEGQKPVSKLGYLRELRESLLQEPTP